MRPHHLPEDSLAPPSEAGGRPGSSGLEILDSLPCPVIIIQEETVHSWNKAAEQWFGLAAREVVGRSLQDLPLGWDAKLVVRTLAACRKKGCLQRLDAVPLRREGRHEGVFRLTFTPLMGGHTQGELIMVEDAGAMDRRSRPSSRDLVHLEAMMENSTDGIVSIDHKGIIQKANGAMLRIFGYEREELLGRNISILMPSPTREKHDLYLHRHLSTGRTRIIGNRLEVTGRRRDGTTFPIELGVSEVRLPEGSFYTGILRDITQRKSAEVRLRRLAKAIEQAGEAVVITDLDG
ncbi:MAG: PAS domain S-box protein, partial [Acidobacteriota bacterium]